MKRQSLLMVLLPLLFLLPYPTLGQTVGPLTIGEDTTLDDDHEGNIIIGADGVTLDCDGFTVSGPGIGVGIDLSNRTKVTVKNCHVHGFDVGFNLFESDKNRFEYNTAEGNIRNGFLLGGSDKNKFKENTAESNGDFGADSGFQLNDSDKNKFEYNTANGNNQGFTIRTSNNNKFKYNTAEGNDIDGFGISASNNNTLKKNTAYANAFRGFSIGNGSNNNTLEKNTAEGSGMSGFQILQSRGGIGSDNNTLKKNTAEGNGRHGFAVAGSSGNLFEKNTAHANSRDGFRSVGVSNNNTFEKNTAHDNSENGFFVGRPSNNNTFEKNTAHGNIFHGFRLLGSDNTLRKNKAKGNGLSGFNLEGSSSNLLEKNIANNNGNYGFEVLATSLLNTFNKNKACRNGILDVLDATFGTSNVWVKNNFCAAGCLAPPVISSVTPSEIPAPDTGGEFFEGRFKIVGENFQGGEIFVDGPLVVVGDPQINSSATVIKKEFSIGCCVPRDEWIGRTFDVIVPTACGVATSPVLIVAE